MKGFWFTEEFDSGLRVGLEVERTLFTGRSKYQRVEVFETKTFGKTLAIDGLFMTSVVDEANYHELLVQVPMCTAPRI
ncbi:MAG: spermidine synthase, partial [Myxococcota bacterium]